jgi:Protein of unknown function (DUF4238)
MAYPSVNKGHIVPRVYLRNFARGEQIEVHIVDKGSSHVVNIQKAGTRQRPYRRTRPRSGEEIDDVEWSLQHIERAAGPILGDVDQRWPLTFDDKRTLAEFFAVQMVRGPGFFAYRANLIDSTRGLVEQYFANIAVPERVIEHQTAKHRADSLSDTQRLVSMLGLSRPLTIYLGSMHWTLLRFKDPVIALSDQPVVIWPLARGRADASEAPAWGPEQALEVRAPVSPYLAIVMAWFDQGDGRARDGRTGQAKALNAFTIAQADRQWMHLPGHSPAVRQGRFNPLSPQVNRGYTAQSAQRSWRRTEAARLADRRRGASNADRELEIVRMEPIEVGARSGPSPDT